MAETKRRDGWDKAEIISRIVSALVVPTVLAILGVSINDALKDKEIKARYVELAINVLTAQPKKGEDAISDKNLRRWAVEVLARYAPVPLPPDIKQTLLDQTILQLPMPANIQLRPAPDQPQLPTPIPKTK